MQYLTIEEILALHTQIIAQTDGINGVANFGLNVKNFA